MLWRRAQRKRGVRRWYVHIFIYMNCGSEKAKRGECEGDGEGEEGGKGFCHKRAEKINNIVRVN